MSDPRLFGICRDEGPRIDDLLMGLARSLRGRGEQVAGYVQERLLDEDNGCPGILLHDLGTGEKHNISEERGPGATGCNLDWSALTELAAALEATLGQAKPSLVIISRFGKAEAEGRGFCGVIEHCVERGIPVLVAYRAGFSEAWAGYHGGFARELSETETDALLAELAGELRGVAADHP